MSYDPGKDEQEHIDLEAKEIEIFEDINRLFIKIDELRRAPVRCNLAGFQRAERPIAAIERKLKMAEAEQRRIIASLSWDNTKSHEAR